jgi:hypothetical protein
MGQKSYFPGEVTPGSEGKNCQIGKIFSRNCSELFKRATVQKGYTNEGTSPDLDGVNYARPLKVTIAERFLKGSYTCALIFKPSRLWQRANSCLWPRPSFKQSQYGHFYYLQICPSNNTQSCLYFFLYSTFNGI